MGKNSSPWVKFDSLNDCHFFNLQLYEFGHNKIYTFSEILALALCLVTPRSKKSIKTLFSKQFQFYHQKIENFSKIWVVYARYV